MACPSVKEIIAGVEQGALTATLEDHLEACDACRAIYRGLRDETEGLTISIGSLWIRERISCPHDDILLSFVNGTLDEEESRFIDFHVGEVACPYCQAAVSEFQALVDREAPKRLKSAMEKSLRSSATFFDGLER